MESTVYICPALSLQRACKIFKIEVLTKNPLGLLFLLVRDNVLHSGVILG